MTDVAALLLDSNVRRALIVDDAYDSIPLAMDLALDADEWTHFFDDLVANDRTILREIYQDFDRRRGDELQADDDFVAALWNAGGRLRPELVDPLLARYRLASETDLAYLQGLKASLEGFGLTCVTAGRDFGEQAADTDLVVIDLFLGSAQRPDDIESAIEGLTAVIAARPARPPLVVLMSRSSRLEEKREEFRDRCALFASAFRIIGKAELADAGKLGRLLARLSTHSIDSRKLAEFVDAWRLGLDEARIRTTSLIRRLELSDHAQIHQLLLSAEGEPTGSYLVDVFDAVLRHELEGETAIIDKAIALNALTADKYPPPYLAGSRDLQDLVQRTLFQNRERLRLQAVGGSPVAFGDLLRRRAAGNVVPEAAVVAGDQPPIDEIEHDQVLLTVTPACDLQREGQGAKNILFTVGRLKPLGPADWHYQDDPVRTPVIELAGEARKWIHWDLKHIVSLSPAQVSRLIQEQPGFHIVARLRESHALELQQRLVASLGRVGLIAPMPATFLMKVELWLAGLDRRALRVAVPSLSEDGVCFVGRPGDKDMRLVLTEDQCEGISSSIRAFDLNLVHPNSRAPLEYARESADLPIALERGITLPSVQNTNFKDIPSPTGASIGSHIRTIGLIVRNRSFESVNLSEKEVAKAGIVLATWDHD